MKNAIINICDKEFSEFLSKKNVVGIGLGSIVTSGINTNIPCIKIMVTKKLPLNKIDYKDLVPKIYKELKTDIIEVDEISPLGFRDKVRPLVFGSSVGISTVPGTGTAGALVTDGRNYYILSNNHVLAYSNYAPIGEPILQPGRGDGGAYPYDVVAHLSKFIPLQYIKGTYAPINYVDAAIAKINKNIPVSEYINNIGLPKGVITSPAIGTKVKKSGRRTGFSTGSIVATNATVYLSYSPTPYAKENSALFKNQFVAELYASVGDSGSLILDEDNFGVGLLFSGGSSTVYFSPLDMVLSLLNVSLVTCSSH